jgi:hypothetical protein
VGIGERFDWFHGVDMEDTLHLNLNSAVHAVDRVQLVIIRYEPRGSMALNCHQFHWRSEAILNSSLDRPLHVVSYEFRSRFHHFISTVQG